MAPARRSIVQTRRHGRPQLWRGLVAGDRNQQPFQLLLIVLQGEGHMSHKNTVRVVTRAADGTLRIRDYPSTEPLLEMHSQIGIDDCSTDLALRGFPVFRGLIGPMPEGKNVVRYESPDVFETLTKEWSKIGRAHV